MNIADVLSSPLIPTQASKIHNDLLECTGGNMMACMCTKSRTFSKPKGSFVFGMIQENLMSETKYNTSRGRPKWEFSRDMLSLHPTQLSTLLNGKFGRSSRCHTHKYLLIPYTLRLTYSVPQTSEYQNASSHYQCLSSLFSSNLVFKLYMFPPKRPQMNCDELQKPKETRDDLPQA